MKTKTKRKMNVALLKKVKAWISNRPTQVYMNSYYGISGPCGCEPKGCGTAACIAGVALVIVKRQSPASCLGRIEGFFDKAADAIGLNDQQASRLFLLPDHGFHNHWPFRFSKALSDAKTPNEYAQVVAKRIDHFIKTKGRS